MNKETQKGLSPKTALFIISFSTATDRTAISSILADDFRFVVHDDFGKWASLDFAIFQYIIKIGIPANKFIITCTKPFIFSMYDDSIIASLSAVRKCWKVYRKHMTMSITKI